MLTAGTRRLAERIARLPSGPLDRKELPVSVPVGLAYALKTLKAMQDEGVTVMGVYLHPLASDEYTVMAVPNIGTAFSVATTQGKVVPTGGTEKFNPILSVMDFITLSYIFFPETLRSQSTPPVSHLDRRLLWKLHNADT